jgi:long-subunit acyl-CoA synthetase (AMP-forming)
VHRLSGIVTPASAVYSARELCHQLQSSDAKAIFTCVSLLGTAVEAARACGIPEDRIFLFELPGDPQQMPPYATVNQLIIEGRTLAELEPLRWSKGQGARQVAFLSYSSGTSGLPVSSGTLSRYVLC